MARASALYHSPFLPRRQETAHRGTWFYLGMASLRPTCYYHRRRRSESMWLDEEELVADCLELTMTD
jgi:hypothetical protein